MIHVSAQYIEAYNDDNNPYKYHIAVSLIYYTLPRFAVPCFMMLSGALLLSNEKNKCGRYFYKKAFIHLGIPTLIFSILYFGYSVVKALARMAVRGVGIRALYGPIRDVVVGEPFYHMWYLYTLIGVYLLIPVIFKIKDDMSEKSFAIFSWLYFLIAVASGFTSTYKLNWSISKVVCYIGFILVGYQIKCITNKKNNLKGIMFIISSFLLLLLLTYIQYIITVAGITMKFSLIGNFSPDIALVSVLIFTGFSLLHIKSDYRIERLSRDTFILYLFHAGVWDIYNVLLALVGTKTKTNPIYTIPICIVVVFFISWALCPVYEKLWALINKNNRISDRMCAFLRL